jgi:hypothetical protein
VLTIADSGAGIDEASRDGLFHPVSSPPNAKAAGSA